MELNGIKLVISDVDGTLTTTASGKKFRQDASDWKWLPGRKELCLQLHAQGIKIATATNQGGVAYPWSSFTEEEIQREIDKVSHEIQAIYIGVCYNILDDRALPKYNKKDIRRKPGPGMIEEAIAAAGVSKEETIMVGDMDSDQKAAIAAGVKFAWAHEFFA